MNGAVYFVQIRASKSIMAIILCDFCHHNQSLHLFCANFQAKINKDDLFVQKDISQESYLNILCKKINKTDKEDNFSSRF